MNYLNCNRCNVVTDEPEALLVVVTDAAGNELRSCMECLEPGDLVVRRPTADDS